MARARILLVDDDDLTLRDTRRELEASGYEVVAAVHSADEALAAMEKTEADVALMDVEIEGEIDGIEAAAMLRNRFGLPVIYLTAHTEDDVIERAKATEPLGFVRKPFGERDLFVAVEMALARHRHERLVQAYADNMARTNDAMQHLKSELLDTSTDPRLVPVSTFVALTLSNVVASLSDLKEITDAMADRRAQPDACHLMQCPRKTMLEDTVRDAIDVIEKTRGAFRSKDLGALRKRLERALATSTGIGA